VSAEDRKREQLRQQYTHAAARAYALQVLQRLQRAVEVERVRASHGLPDGLEPVADAQWERMEALVFEAARKA